MLFVARRFLLLGSVRANGSVLGTRSHIDIAAIGRLKFADCARPSTPG